MHKKLMNGFPAKRDTQLSWNNYRDSENELSWSHVNLGQFQPINIVPRNGDVLNFEEQINNSLVTKAELTVFKKTNIDALLIIKENKLIYEKYFNYTSRTKQHLWYSISKSLVSSVFLIMNESLGINLDDSINKYIKELEKDNGFFNSTFRQLLNHSSGINFDENYRDENSDFTKHYTMVSSLINTNNFERWPDVIKEDVLGIYDFLLKWVKPNKKVKPGTSFEYQTPNTDILSWALTRATNENLETLVSNTIWSKIGANNDGYFWSDRSLTSIAGGGFNSTAIDAAKFAHLFINEGNNLNNEKVLNSNIINDIFENDNSEIWNHKLYDKFTNSNIKGYYNGFWKTNNKDELICLGIHSQIIYINRKTKKIVVLFSSSKFMTAFGTKEALDTLNKILLIGRNLI